MGYDPGDIKVFNPNKEISKEITLEILIRHRDALKQARTGELVGIPIQNIRDNDRKINQAKALNLIVASQREMITASRPIIFFSSTKKWEKRYNTDEEKMKHPFLEEKNDYNNLMGWLEFLRECERSILNAEITKSYNDDFLVNKNNNNNAEEVKELTQNFYDMLEDLESSYEQIYLIMLINKIVSAGIEDDDEMTYKEKEQEAIRRVMEA